MKKFIIFLIIIIGSSCKDDSLHIPFVKPVYHIKVEYWMDCYWCIKFTDNNFLTEETINECWDGSGNITGNDVIHQLMLARNQKDLINLAKKFTDYESCIRWNDSVKRKANALSAYRNLHPIAITYKEDDDDCCTSDKGKQVIIH